MRRFLHAPTHSRPQRESARSCPAAWPNTRLRPVDYRFSAERGALQVKKTNRSIGRTGDLRLWRSERVSRSAQLRARPLVGSSSCSGRLVACASAVLKRLQLTARVEAGGFGKNDGMNVALIVIVLLMLFVPFVLVGVMFVWGAAKDGQEDRAVQRRLGIRRRTRLGR